MLRGGRIRNSVVSIMQTISIETIRYKRRNRNNIDWLAELDARDVDTVFVYSSDAQLVLSSGPFLPYKVSGSLTPLAPCPLVAVSYHESPVYRSAQSLATSLQSHSSFRRVPVTWERTKSHCGTTLICSLGTMIFDILCNTVLSQDRCLFDEEREYLNRRILRVHNLSRYFCAIFNLSKINILSRIVFLSFYIYLN